MNAPELPGAESAHLPFVSVESRRATLSLLTSVGAFESGPTGAWNFVNPQLCDMLGVPASSLLGREWIKLIHSDDLQRTVAEYKQARDGGRSWHHQFRMNCYDGSIIHVQVDANPLLKDPGVRGISYLGIVSDVTALKRAQNIVEEARSSVEELLQVIDEGIVIHRDGWIVAANKYAAELLGYSTPSDIIGLHRTTYAAPEDLPALEAASRSNASAYTIATFVRPNGERFRAGVRAKPVVFAGAPARAAVITPLDAPLLSNLTQARVEAQIHALLDQLTLPYNQIALRNDEIVVIAANQAYADFVGRPLSDIIGRELKDLVPLEINEQIWEGHVESLRAGRRRATFDATYQRPDGTLVRGRVHTVDYRDPVTDEAAAMSFIVPM